MTISSVFTSFFKFIEEFFRVTWLSISSTKFYPDLYTKYKGYGFKYITIAMTITSIIYSFLVFDNVTTIRNYLMATGDDDNPVEHILKQWPEVQYNGKEISLATEQPVLIHTSKGQITIAIDPDNKLSFDQKNSIPVILQKTQITLNFTSHNDPNSKYGKISFGYSAVPGLKQSIVNRDGLKALLIEELEPFGITMFITVILLLIPMRLAMHIFSIGTLYRAVIVSGALWMMNLKPNIISVSRVIMFSSGAAELITPILLVFAPGLLIFALLVEIWSIILAIYSLSTIRKTT